jgi:hypothetical protein
MLQLRDGSCLALEPSLAVRIGSEADGQHFDGHTPVKAGVAGAPHVAHASRADPRVELVRAQARAWRDCHDARIIACDRSPAVPSIEKRSHPIA